MKSFKPKEPPGSDEEDGGGRNAPADFRGQKRSNATHCSTTDPDARLYRKGPGMEARLCYIGYGLMENRLGFWWMPGSPWCPGMPSGWRRSI